MSNLKRPGRGESEEDLLHFQQQYLAQQKATESASASACVIVKDSTDSKTGIKRKSQICDVSKDEKNMDDNNDLPSKVPTYEKTKPKSRFKKGREPLYEIPGTDSKDILLDSDTKVSTFLTQIVERDTTHLMITEPKPSSIAFPVVAHRTVNAAKIKSTGEKISIYAQQYVKNDEECMEDVTRLKSKSKGFRPSSLVQGSGLSVSFADQEVRKIHRENIGKLSAMTEAEILEEQTKLCESIDPKLLAYFKSKRSSNTKEGKIPEAASEVKETKFVASSTEADKHVSYQDLPVKREKGWIGMDNIEYDKLEWMKEVPPITTGGGTDKQARFDLYGHFIVADADIALHEGLHHHGDEPERAGYTLEEIFHLARSSNIPQRKLALTTLAKILAKCKQGDYVNHIQAPILPTVLQAGVIFLLRWALDDSTESIQMATISALYSLLCCKLDEENIDIVSYWYQGLVQPSLICSPPEDVATDTQDDDKAQESDDEVARRDLVQALVTRMMLLPRLKYILMEKCLSPPSIIHILSILTRVAHHCSSTAYEIVSCPGFLKYIFDEFLPTTWDRVESKTQVFSARKYPIPEAMKLITAICKAGKNMTAIMISTYSLQDVIQRYIAVTASDLQLPYSVAAQLQKQSYIAWKICLTYGLAGELYLNLYSVFVQNLQTCQYAIFNNEPCEYSRLISGLQSVLHVAALPKQQTSFNNQEELMKSDEEDESIDNVLDWSNVYSIVDILLPSLTHVLHHIGNNYQFQRLDLDMVTCLTGFMASYYDKINSQVGYNAVETLQKIEHFCQTVLLPFWKSLGFRYMLVNICEYSNLLCEVLQHKEMSPSLPSYGGSCLVNGTSLPILQETSPFGFLTAYLRLIMSICRLHKGMIDEMLPCIVNDEEIISYIRKICQHKNSTLYSNCFTKFENILQYQIVKLCSLKECEHMSLMHSASLQLLLRLQHGDEYLIHDLFSYVVFSPQFLSETRNVAESLQSMADLELREVKKLKSATQEEIYLVRSQLLEAARNDLLSGCIQTVYLSVFSGGKLQAAKSRGRYNHITTHIDCLLSGQVEENILPQDWMFLPLVELYNTSTLRSDDDMSVQNIRLVSSVLEWIYLLECQRPEILRSVSVTLKLSRIICTFLADNDLFLEKCIQSYLAALLREYTKPVLLEQMNFSKAIPGLNSFFDLYQSLLEQYGAISFGDSVFGSYVLIPIQQFQSIDLRLSLWGEHHEALRALNISVSELLLPIERYLQPDECDCFLLQQYFTCLASQLIIPTRTPVPYIIAVHHVNHFLYYTQDTNNHKSRAEMWNWMKTLKLQQLRSHLLYYKKVNSDEEFCMELYTQLPTNRQITVNKYINILQVNHIV